MFAAYMTGRAISRSDIDGGLLPQETQLYVAKITGFAPMRAGARSFARFTRPDGEAVMINGFAVTAVRAPLPGEYPPDVNAVIAMGRMSQAVCETLGQTTRLLPRAWRKGLKGVNGDSIPEFGGMRANWGVVRL